MASDPFILGLLHAALDQHIGVRRHCEELSSSSLRNDSDEAIQFSLGTLDCFASLAMTKNNTELVTP